MIAGWVLIGALAAASLIVVCAALIATFAPHLMHLTARTNRRPEGTR